MLPPSPERSGGFHVAVAHFFDVAVDQGVSEFEQRLVAFGFDGFAFVVGDGFFDQFLLFEVFADGCEVAFGEGADVVFGVEDGFEVGEEVFDEDGGCFGVAEVHSFWVHGGEEGC